MNLFALLFFRIDFILVSRSFVFLSLRVNHLFSLAYAHFFFRHASGAIPWTVFSGVSCLDSHLILRFQKTVFLDNQTNARFSSHLSRFLCRSNVNFHEESFIAFAFLSLYLSFSLSISFCLSLSLSLSLSLCLSVVLLSSFPPLFLSFTSFFWRLFFGDVSSSTRIIIYVFLFSFQLLPGTIGFCPWWMRLSAWVCSPEVPKVGGWCHHILFGIRFFANLVVQFYFVYFQLLFCSIFDRPLVDDQISCLSLNCFSCSTSDLVHLSCFNSLFSVSWYLFRPLSLFLSRFNLVVTCSTYTLLSIMWMNVN